MSEHGPGSIFESEPTIDTTQTRAYDYALPEAQIAAHPSADRARARLMVIDPQGQLTHARFDALSQWLRPGDLLVFNDARVIPARVIARKPTGGKVELLALAVCDARGVDLSPSAWELTPSEGWVWLRCMTRGMQRVAPGATLATDAGVALEVVSLASGEAVIGCAWDETPLMLLERLGRLPLPPYIERQRERQGEEVAHEDDARDYQTVLARAPGAVAAPTAGLHFTRELLEVLKARGVAVATLTLHVGVGTFKPVSADALTDHPMHSERYELGSELVQALAKARAAGGRVIAVGTTSARVLEAEARRDAPFVPGERATDILLHPGHGFCYCDGLITNFHLPRSTLLAMVSAAMGYATMRRAYEEAVREGYRFYSYGDAMFITSIKREGDEPQEEMT